MQSVYGRFLLIAIGVFALSACASKPAEKDVDLVKTTANLKELARPSVSGALNSASTEGLDGKLLQNLLLARFAVYSSDWKTSFSETAEAAAKTQDWRLAKTATEVGFHLDKNYADTYEVARLWSLLQPDDILAKLYVVASGVAAEHSGATVPIAIEFIERHPQGQIHAFQVLSEFLRNQPSASAIGLMVVLESRYGHQADFLYESILVNAWFKKDKRSRDYLERTLELDQDHERANVFKYQLILIEQDEAAANAYLRSQIERFPQSKNLRNQYLSYLYSEQKYQEIVNLTEGVDSGDLRVEENASAAFLRGASLVQLDRLPEAESSLARVLAINPQDQGTRLQLGRVYYTDKQYQRAVDVLQEIKGGEQLFDASLVIARAQTKLHEGEVGIQRALRKLNGLAANTKTHIIERALMQSELLSDANQFKRALGYLGDAIAAYPNDERLLYARGLLAADTKELAIAEADLSKLIALRPKNAVALNALGYTLIEQSKRYDEAQVFIDRALALQPNSHYILDSAGWLAYKLGDTNKALDLLRKAYAVEKHPEIAAHLGEVLHTVGDVNKARDIWQEAFSLSPDNETLINTINRFGVSNSGVSNNEPSQF